MSTEIQFTYTFGQNNTGITATSVDAFIDFSQFTTFTYGGSSGNEFTADHYDGSGSVSAVVNGISTNFTVYGVNYLATDPAGTQYILVAQTDDNHLLNFYFGDTQPSTINAEYAAIINTNYSDSANDVVQANSTEVTCFTTGTLIRTAHGDVAVETLSTGDLAITASGEQRPIRWIGHRDLDGAGAPLPLAQSPVRVLPGAFGPGLPARTLYLSPGHPVLVGGDEDGEGGHLVPIMCLVNGTTIEREPRDSVTYWHVELDRHDILLAEGLPAESYLDWGDRPFFTEAADHALADPDFVVPGLGSRCRPVAVDGPVVEAERRRLDAVFAVSLAAPCTWPTAGEVEFGF